MQVFLGLQFNGLTQTKKVTYILDNVVESFLFHPTYFFQKMLNKLLIVWVLEWKTNYARSFESGKRHSFFFCFVNFKFMGLFTYKVFNVHLFIQCKTYYPHLIYQHLFILFLKKKYLTLFCTF